MTIRNSFPDVRPALNLDFANTKRLDPRITFTRSSTGTYVDEFGVIKTAASNEARFDHDSDGNSLGLLIEESRTNLITYSEDLSNAAWSVSNATISSNVSTAPDGNTTADKLIEGTSAAEKLVHQRPGSSTSNGNIFIFAKAAGRSSLLIRHTGYYDTQTDFEFNLANGTVTQNGGLSDTKITPYPNGWYLCQTGNFRLGFHARDVYFGISDTSAGDGSSGILLWGGQAETGSFPTSYIPTSGSTATRSADVASMTGTNFSSWYNQSEGSILAVARIGDLSTANQSIASVEETASTVQFNAVGYRVGGGGSGYIGAWSYNASGQAFFNINAGITSSTEFKAVHSYKTDDYAASVNGSVPVTDTVGNVSTVIDRLRIGSYVYGSVVTGTISRLTYYDRRLTDAQLQALTL